LLAVEKNKNIRKIDEKIQTTENESKNLNANLSMLRFETNSMVAVVANRKIAIESISVNYAKLFLN